MHVLFLQYVRVRNRQHCVWPFLKSVRCFVLRILRHIHKVPDLGSTEVRKQFVFLFNVLEDVKGNAQHMECSSLTMQINSHMSVNVFAEQYVCCDVF